MLLSDWPTISSFCLETKAWLVERPRRLIGCFWCSSVARRYFEPLLVLVFSQQPLHVLGSIEMGRQTDGPAEVWADGCSMCSVKQWIVTLWTEKDAWVWLCKAKVKTTSQNISIYTQTYSCTLTWVLMTLWAESMWDSKSCSLRCVAWLTHH